LKMDKAQETEGFRHAVTLQQQRENRMQQKGKPK